MSDKILIVDDHIEILDLLTYFLSDKYRIIQATSSLDALEILKKQTPSLIISDLLMPKMDGIEFFKSIRENENFPYIPFIILTSVNTEAIEEFSFSFGIDEYLRKPVEKEDLHKVVARILKSTEAFRVTNKNKIVLKGVIKERFDDKLISNLYQIIQTRRTGVFDIVKDQIIEGFIWFRDGQFIKASFDKKKNEKAIERILKLDAGVYAFQEKNVSNIKSTIEDNAMNLIMNICKERDERLTKKK